MNQIIPANPGFNALTFFINEAGKPSYYREAVIAWELRITAAAPGVIDAAPTGEPLCHWAAPILPGGIGSFDEWDAIEDPNGTISTIGNTFRSINDCLEHWAKARQQ